MHPPRETKRIWRNDDESEIYVTKATSAMRHPVPALLLCLTSAKLVVPLAQSIDFDGQATFSLFSRNEIIVLLRGNTSLEIGFVAL